MSLVNIRLPISEYQKRFFLEWVLAPEENTYNVSLVYKLSSNLDRESLKCACEAFIKKYRVIHSCYSENGDICYDGNYSIDDIYAEVILDPLIDIEKQIRYFIGKPFNLVKGNLWKFYLFKDLNYSNDYYFILSAHHIVADGTMGKLYTIEIANFYNLAVENKLSEFDFNDLAKSELDKFNKIINFEQAFFTKESLQNARDFWLKFIADIPLNVQLPYKINNIMKLDNNKESGCIYFELDKKQSSLLNSYARKNNTTLFLLLATIYGVIISKYSNQKKLIISYPLNMRPKDYGMVGGCFVNNTLMKLELDCHNTLKSLLNDISNMRKNVRDHQWYLLTNIINDQRNIQNQNLDKYFNVGFGQTVLGGMPLNLNGVVSESKMLQWSQNAIYELELLYEEMGPEQIKFRFSYQKSLFDESLIHDFINSFKNLVNNLIITDNNSTDFDLSKYSVLNKIHYNKIIKEWNNTDKAYPTSKLVQDLFEEQVKRTPDNIALVYEDTKVTYKELNERSNQLAHYLMKAYDISGDDLIALCLDRSEQMLIGILGVLKSGGAYVPMDPSYPDDRISYILNDTRAKVLLTNQIYTSRIDGIIKDGKCTTRMELLDGNEFLLELSKHKKTNPKSIIKSNNLAYVIYTSGTTGKPKGVMIEHNSVINLLLSLNSVYDFTYGNKVSFFTSYVFDVSVSEIFVFFQKS